MRYDSDADLPAEGGFHMSSSDNSNDMYTQLMALSQRAFSGGQFAVAYHALAAATHCAIDLQDEEQLLEVERVAYEQIQWIDSYAPTDMLSTLSSKSRHTHNLWTSLANQARTRRRMLRPAHVFDEEVPPPQVAGKP